MWQRITKKRLNPTNLGIISVTVSASTKFSEIVGVMQIFYLTKFFRFRYKVKKKIITLSPLPFFQTMSDLKIKILLIGFFKN